MTTLTDDELLSWLEETSDKAHATASRSAPQLRQLAARFRELLAQQEWQPIETAPKDGTLIEIREKSGRVQIAQWGEPGYNEPNWWVQLTQGGFSMNEYPTTNVTHWRPLPAPPKDG